ncbi:hypothetical protein CWATWH0005_4011 [Crocosphaera watsonii WH 0005]|nr:hypothetical protein CWATWH0005_4011 [Crocosphaera watsonii WH 0005]
MMTTIVTTTILLASLAPVSFFFGLTTHNYFFLLLMHVAIFGLCGLYGVQYLYRGCSYIALRMEQPLNHLLLRIWIVMYSLVGMQLGWRLRPFIATPGTDESLISGTAGWQLLYSSSQFYLSAFPELGVMT